eukprot:129688-Prymnesium_polylepis.1
MLQAKHKPEHPVVCHIMASDAAASARAWLAAAGPLCAVVNFDAWRGMAQCRRPPPRSRDRVTRRFRKICESDEAQLT